MWGSRISLLELVKGLNKETFFPIVAVPGKGGLEGYLKENMIDVRILPLKPYRKLKYMPLRPYTKYMLHRIMKDEGIQLVHNNEFWSNPYGVDPAKSLGIPVICHVRGALTSRQIVNYKLEKADKIICVSNDVALQFKDDPHLSFKIEVIYNGLNLETFTANATPSALRREFNIADDEIVICQIGKLVPRKAQEVTIKAAKIVHEKKKNVRFFIVGKGWEKEQEYVTHLFELVRQLDLEGVITFTGYRTDIPSWCALMDMLVIPSYSEGFGRVNIEAMAFGKPVIGSDAEGISEVVHNNITGSIFAKGDHVALAEAILRYIADPELRKQDGLRGRKRVEENFTMQHHIRQVEELYLNLLK